jgi:hypothetical protein
LENKNQEIKDLLAEKKAAVSQLQDQHAIELAKHKTELDEERSKLQLVTQELEWHKTTQRRQQELLEIVKSVRDAKPATGWLTDRLAKASLLLRTVQNYTRARSAK